VNKARILIVEDEYLVARDVSHMVLELGYEVTGIASTAEAAINAVHETRPDLVLLDIVLKGSVDGISVAELIKQESGTPVIFLTAHADEMTLSRAKITDPLGYLLKPFEMRELKTAVDLAFYKARKEREAPREIFDVLSGLPDRAHFIDLAAKAIFLAERRNTAIAILGFSITPSLPVDAVSAAESPAVDAVIAERLTKTLRKSDTVSRVKRGIFMILLPDLEHDRHAWDAARRILKILQEPSTVDGRLIPLRIASSIVVSTRDGRDPETLLQKAMDAMAVAAPDGKG